MARRAWRGVRRTRRSVCGVMPCSTYQCCGLVLLLQKIGQCALQRLLHGLELRAWQLRLHPLFDEHEADRRAAGCPAPVARRLRVSACAGARCRTAGLIGLRTAAAARVAVILFSITSSLSSSNERAAVYWPWPVWRWRWWPGAMPAPRMRSSAHGAAGRASRGVAARSHLAQCLARHAFNSRWSVAKSCSSAASCAQRPCTKRSASTCWLR